MFVRRAAEREFELPRETIEHTSVLVARALVRHTEVLHIVVAWEEEE
jgi:hypothetical protein